MQSNGSAMESLAVRRWACGHDNNTCGRPEQPMIDGYSRGLTVIAAVGAGVAAGVYFAFSTFVLPGLRRTSSAQAISAMNGINKAAPASPLLMLVLFGTGAACILLMISSFRPGGDPAAVWRIVGCALYLASVVITV